MKTNSLEGIPHLKTYKHRQLPNSVDRETYEKCKSTPPTAAEFPTAFAWFVLVGRFSDAVRESWQQAGGAKGKQAAPAKKEEATKKADDDEMDLFGDDDEDDAVFINYYTSI